MGRINEHGIRSALSSKLKGLPLGQLAYLALFLTSSLAAGQSESHAWLGSTPSMKEWIGKRIVQAPQDFDFKIKNRKFSLFGAMPLDLLNNDKTETGEAQAWLDDLIEAYPLHREELIAELINSSETSICFTGSSFFNTTHSFGKSGTFSNSLTETGIGAPTAATAAEMAIAINKAVEHMHALPDDQGRKIANRGMTALDVVCAAGTANAAAARQAISADRIDTGSGFIDNPLKGQNISIQLQTDGLITLDQTKFAVLRSRRQGDNRARPLVYQENEGDRRIDILDENTAKQFVVENDSVGIALKCVDNAGHGLPTHAVLTTLSA